MAMSTVLFDMPISNMGARCRFVIYEKGIEQEIKIQSPMDLGGLKSSEYLSNVNPHGKMPALVQKDGDGKVAFSLPESDTIVRYFLSKYSDKGPSFTPENPETKAKADLISRYHDMYFTSVMVCNSSDIKGLKIPLGMHVQEDSPLRNFRRSYRCVGGDKEADKHN